MVPSRLELPPELAGRLLRFPALEFVHPGLWRLEAGPLQVELDRLAGVEDPGERPLWLRLDPAGEVAAGEACLDVALPPEVRFLPLPEEPPLPEAAASLVVPGELVEATPVLVYRPLPPEAPGPEDSGDPGTTSLPVPGSRVLGTPEDGTRLLPSPRLRCRVRDAHGVWTLDVVPDPSRTAEALALCPLCDEPADRWYSCAEHGPHCSSHRKVCRSCRRGECAACFRTTCGTCGNALCPACGTPPCCCGDHGSCPSHRAVCSECHGTHCTACGGGTCAVGETDLCSQCSGTCSACGSTVRHRLLTPCFTCGARVCPNCSDNCHLDGRALCPAHGATCGECGRSLCEAHREACRSCGRDHCRTHLSTCPTCGRPTCSACRPGGACRQCRSVGAVDPSLRGRVEALASGQPWAGFSGFRGAEGSAGWLFALGVGLQEFRVSTDLELTRVESVHRRTLLQRVLGRG